MVDTVSALGFKRGSIYDQEQACDYMCSKPQTIKTLSGWELGFFVSSLQASAQVYPFCVFPLLLCGLCPATVLAVSLPSEFINPDCGLQ